MNTVYLSFMLCLLALGACQPVANRTEEVDRDAALGQALDSLFKEQLREKKMAGLVCLISEKGKVVYENALGHRNLELDLPMELQTRFRLQSMAKPLITVAILKLCGEGKLQLDDPAHLYFPQLKKKQVGVMREGKLMYEQANQPITIRHLLSHSSGLGFSWNAGDLSAAYAEHESATTFTSYEHWIESYMELPLIDQPGRGWYYGHGHAILEYLITKVSGMPHKDYLAREIFAPLEMHHTTYQLPAGEEHSLAQYYSTTETGQLKRMLPDSAYTGGDDPMSTVGDYYKFCQMLLRNGTIGNREFIKPALIREMITPTVGLEGESIWLQKGYAFGLGVSVRVGDDKADAKGTIGDYGWNGFYNTNFWIDPEKQIIGLIFTQSPFHNYQLSKDVKNILYSHNSR